MNDISISTLPNSTSAIAYGGDIALPRYSDGGLATARTITDGSIREVEGTAADERVPSTSDWLDEDLDLRGAKLPSHHRALVGSPFEGRHVERIRIVRAPDRLQLRTVITGSKVISTTSYISSKFRHVRSGEGMTEAFRHLEEEVRVDVIDAVSQFCRVEVEMDDGVHRTVPDGAALYANGRRAFIDIKRDWSGYRTSAGIRQSALVRLAAASMGWDYERYVLASAGPDDRREAIDEIQDARFVKVPPISAAHALSALGGGSMSLGRLSGLLHPAYGRRMACAMMVGRLVEIDISRRLDARSECRAVPPLPSGMPGIRH